MAGQRTVHIIKLKLELLSIDLRTAKTTRIHKGHITILLISTCNIISIYMYN